MNQFKEPPICLTAKIRQLEWTGHECEWDVSNATHRAFMGVAAGKKNIARPKLRCIDNIEKAATAMVKEIGGRCHRIEIVGEIF